MQNYELTRIFCCFVSQIISRIEKPKFSKPRKWDKEELFENWVKKQHKIDRDFLKCSDQLDLDKHEVDLIHKQVTARQKDSLQLKKDFSTYSIGDPLGVQYQIFVLKQIQRHFDLTNIRKLCTF